uniref:G domain-containing protein n=1 Tax=Ditylenchus dipsaci TaxID=166011 RepID=A0A915CT27_9BILA
MLLRLFLRGSYRNFCSDTTTPASSQLSNGLFDPRLEFVLPPKVDQKKWYPKHMSIQLQKMEGKLRTVDLILEVHDARVALTGRNPGFGAKLYSVRPHILVLNKMDLIDMKKYKQPIEEYYYHRGVQNVVWTKCKESLKTSDAFEELTRTMQKCLQAELRFNRTVKTEYQVMVVGIPNVGKSSLINALRHNNLGRINKPAQEGARPGVTVRVQNRIRLMDKPPLYILDTPGVLNPYFSSIEGAMKLALCNLILESATMPYYVADFMLYYMNKYNDFSYVEILQLPEPTNDIKKLLTHICKTNDMRVEMYIGARKEERWDFENATAMFIKLFRTNKIKDSFLDRDLLKY